MSEVQVQVVPKGGSARRAAAGVIASRPRSVVSASRRFEWARPGASLALSEARRAWNRDRIGLLAALRCECPHPACTGTVPVVAEVHRRMPDQFLVAPDHHDGGDVVKAADKFFVVELRAQSRQSSAKRARA